MWNAKIITAYPEMFPGVLGHSVIGNALQKKKWSLDKINLHDFGYDNRNSIDSSPFGGGPGMLIRPEVVEKAVNNALKNMKKSGLKRAYEYSHKNIGNLIKGLLDA